MYISLSFFKPALGLGRGSWTLFSFVFDHVIEHRVLERAYTPGSTTVPECLNGRRYCRVYTGSNVSAVTTGIFTLLALPDTYRTPRQCLRMQHEYS